MKTLHSSRETGFVLFITLVLMVLMSIAGIAVLRAVDSSNAVSNNIAFRQSALQTAEVATNAAVAWMRANRSLLSQNQTASGYYAAVPDSGTDALGDRTTVLTDNIDWYANQATAPYKPSTLVADGNGNRYAYVIHRLCRVVGDFNASGNDCALAGSGNKSFSSKGEAAYGNFALGSSAAVYYRITTRIVGPRDAESFTQTVLRL
ncbi:hypothetical protein [Chitinimonas sp. BJYL2]|uniref:pilus assembly PilX family protein n=1 Tax=Chitinimonas sp. BJYL2 TaxID=2976696 RepID=UPI0022B51F04|nr:hypothetical protein [Chitinimonas sp. BJYL2]